MERAIRTISVERGYDPRHFTLVAFGGAGPLHACALAEALQIPRVLIPRVPGVLSALGMLLSDVTKDYSQTVMLSQDQASDEALETTLSTLRQQAMVDMQSEGFADDQIELFPALDLRYVGQSYELTVPYDQATGFDAASFHAEHRQRFSHANPREAVEVVNVRLKAVGHTPKPRFAPLVPGKPDPKAAHVGYKPVHYALDAEGRTCRPLPSALYLRERLLAGNMIVGPAIIFQLDTTTVVAPGWMATVDTLGNLVMERRG
jgi:N-methylhydantoinase A